jgi:hypothetical protein
MKSIKKIWIWLVCFSFLIISFGCLNTIDRPMSYEKLKGNVVAIEIGYVHEENGWEYFETLVELQPEEIDPFLEKFCKLSFAEYYPPRDAGGETVKLIYKSNAYNLISVYGGSLYNAQGKWGNYGVGVQLISEQAFLDLINRYIVEE